MTKLAVGDVVIFIQDSPYGAVAKGELARVFRINSTEIHMSYSEFDSCNNPVKTQYRKSTGTWNDHMFWEHHYHGSFFRKYRGAKYEHRRP